MPPKKEEIEIVENPIKKDSNTKKVEPNEVKTSQEFTNDKYLEVIMLNDELNMLNKGEVRFKVVKLGNYEFPKTDKDNNPLYDGFGQPEMITSPYVDVTGEGFTGRISTKLLSKEEILKLEPNQRYIGTYYLTELNNNLVPAFTQIVPYALELQAEKKHY